MLISAGLQINLSAGGDSLGLARSEASTSQCFNNVRNAAL